MLDMNARGAPMNVTTGKVSIDTELINFSGVSNPAFTGGGLNDMTTGGIFVGTYWIDFAIRIKTTGLPDTFEYSLDGGATWAGSIGITGLWQSFTGSGGSLVKFAATIGHTAGNRWDYHVTEPGNRAIEISTINVDVTVVDAGAGIVNILDSYANCLMTFPLSALVSFPTRVFDPPYRIAANTRISAVTSGTTGKFCAVVGYYQATNER